MNEISRIDPLKTYTSRYSRLKRLVLSERLLLEFFKSGKHPAYAMHSDIVPEDATIEEIKFDRKHKEVHIVIHSKEFSHVKNGDALPYLVPISMRMTNAR